MIFLRSLAGNKRIFRKGNAIREDLDIFNLNERTAKTCQKYAKSSHKKM